MFELDALIARNVQLVLFEQNCYSPEESCFNDSVSCTSCCTRSGCTCCAGITRRVRSTACTVSEECQKRFNLEVWETAFNCMPLCARVGRRLFCMHGGLSQEIKSWADCNACDVRSKSPTSVCCATCSATWTDHNSSVTGYADSPRGVSKVFDADVVRCFNRNMVLDLIVRGHQVPQDGYEFFADRRLVTVFSAPNYYH